MATANTGKGLLKKVYVKKPTKKKCKGKKK